MKIVIISFCLILFCSVMANAQTATSPITNRPFPEGYVSDGCTRFPEGKYADCCVEHDLDYYYGGSWRERWRSDKRLYKCVKSKGGFKHGVLAIMMWTAVRGLGSPIFPFKFKWGFGKDLEKNKATNQQKTGK